MIEERDLVQNMQNGDAAAFRELVTRYQRNIYYLALDLTSNHHDAEDLSQEVFIKAYQNITNFRGDAKLSSWLYRITVNTHINKARRKSFKARKLDESIHTLPPSRTPRMDVGTTADPEQLAASALINTHIQQALQQLTAKERSIFVLRHYKDLPLKEIADIHQIKVGTVKSLLFRTIQKLQKSLAFYREDFGWES